MKFWFLAGGPFVTDRVRHRGREVASAYERTYGSSEGWWTAMGYVDGALGNVRRPPAYKGVRRSTVDAYAWGYAAGVAERWSGPVLSFQLDYMEVLR